MEFHSMPVHLQEHWLGHVYNDLTGAYAGRTATTPEGQFAELDRAVREAARGAR